MHPKSGWTGAQVCDRARQTLSHWLSRVQRLPPSRVGSTQIFSPPPVSAQAPRLRSQAICRSDFGDGAGTASAAPVTPASSALPAVATAASCAGRGVSTGATVSGTAGADTCAVAVAKASAATGAAEVGDASSAVTRIGSPATAFGVTSPAPGADAPVWQPEASPKRASIRQRRGRRDIWLLGSRRRDVP